MEKPLQNIFKSCSEERVKHMERLTDINEIFRKADRERKPTSLADVGKDGLPETLCRKMDGNEDEAEETLPSAAKGKANGGIAKRSSEKTSTHSNGPDREDEFREALEEMMKEVWKVPGNPSSSQNKGLKMAGEKFSVLGLGGVGVTNIHNDGNTMNFTFGTIQMTSHHYYKQKMDENG